MYALNDSLEKKFGHHDYVISRDQILAEMDGEDLKTSEDSSNASYSKPAQAPTIKTPVDQVIEMIKKYPEWAAANPKRAAFTQNEAFFNTTPKRMKTRRAQVQQALESAITKARTIRTADIAKTRKTSGNSVAEITHGVEGGTM